MASRAGVQRHGEQASVDFGRVLERRPDRLRVVSYGEGVGDDPGPFAQLRQWSLRNPGRLAALQSVFWTLMVLGWLAVVDLVIGSDVLSPVSFITMPVAGAVFGLGMFRLNRQASALSEITYGQRRTVTRAVRLGRGVDDPALAEATVRHARWVQMSARPERWMTLLVWSLLGASGLALVAALVLEDADVAFAGAFSLVVWTLILLVGPRVERRRVAQAQRAEAAATERLGSVDPYS